MRLAGVDLAVRFAGLDLDNPIANASGTISLSSRQAINLKRYGLLFTKTQGLEARAGNPGRRLCETPSGLLNAIGLPRLSFEDFIVQEWPQWQALSQSLNVPVGISFAGETTDGFARLAARLHQLEVSIIKANFGCPNVEIKKGMLFGQNPELAFKTVSVIRQETDQFLLVKLTPNVTNIVEVALAIQEAGANALAAINTILAMDIDIKTGQPVLRNITGGLSGPAIFPIGLRCVWQLTDPKSGVNLPVIGIGGIDCWETAIKYFMAGATMVGIGTANFCNFQTVNAVLLGMAKFCRERGYESIRGIPRAEFPE